MASKVEKQEFERYLAEARSWETDKVKVLEKSRKVAWWIAMGSWGMTFFAVIAVFMLAPLKTVVPYVVRVDNATGAVNVVSAMTDSKTNYNEAVNKYFTQWYVRWREGYSIELVNEYYTNVGLMSAGDEPQKYALSFSPRNPTSPFNVYGKTGKVTVKIKSTSFINPNLALVRYIKQVDNGAAQTTTHWAATIAFHYSGASMSENDRGINPLGFQVTEYRNDPDQQVGEERPAVGAQVP